MEGWKTRILREADELKLKTDKLNSFLCSEEVKKLSGENQYWLVCQKEAMARYLFCLEMRIRLNNIKEN